MSRDDVLKFVNSREWERKFSLEGEEFVIFPNYFKQPRTMLELDTSTTQTTEIHWWFWEKCFINELGFSESVNKKLRKHSITFNIFVRASIAKINKNIIVERYPGYVKHLLKICKEFETDNINTLMQLNSSTQIEHAVMAIEILKLKLHKEISTFPQFTGLMGLTGVAELTELAEITETSVNTSSDSAVLTVSSEVTQGEVTQGEVTQGEPSKPVLIRGMSALDVKSITKVIDDITISQEIPINPEIHHIPHIHKELTFLERISPRLARKHKKRK